MYGPSHPVSIDQHVQKYCVTPDEQFQDMAWRIADTLADNEQHRRDVYLTLLHQLFIPGGRVQRATGAPMRICSHNCLSGDTIVPTVEFGNVPIRDIKSAMIIDGDGNTVSCTSKSFGKDEVFELKLNRYRSHTAVKATANHRWFTPDGKELKTSQLRVGSKLAAVSPLKQPKNVSVYTEGLVHGIIYGDGTNSHGHAAIRVCSDQDIFVPILEGFGFSKTFPPSAGGDPYLSLPKMGPAYKALPTTHEFDYLLGFVRGWFAADGCVSTQPEVLLTADKLGGDWLKKFGPVVGWFVQGESKFTDEVTNLGRRTRDTFNFRISRDGLIEEDIIIPRKRERFKESRISEWTVNGIRLVGEEEVFCFSVPTTASFMLDKGLLTGNCFVSGTIKDDSVDIIDKVSEAFQTMRMGGGIGYDFSTLRWRGAFIKSLRSTASGAVSFMGIYNEACKTVRSAGGRRGAQMSVLRIDHPDIEEFIDAKTAASSEDMDKAAFLLTAKRAELSKQLENTVQVTLEDSELKEARDRLSFFIDLEPLILEIVEKVSIQNRLSAFNMSVAITDKFMQAVEDDSEFDLVFESEVVRTVRAVDLWDKLMSATWDWAEPGVLFIDRINDMNNLWYCETIAATNPCGEQPLPPYGACLLGSFTAPKYMRKHGVQWFFDYEAFKADIPGIVRMMDNVIDQALYPLPQQEKEAKDKRRMGLGITGVANAIEAMGAPYGSDEYILHQDKILKTLLNETYRASALLAKEKGPFPLWDRDEFMAGNFIRSGVLDADVLELMHTHGLRNSHLTSIAPTGTISLTADNVSSGIEPVFSYMTGRDIINEDGVTKSYVEIDDYGVREFGVYGKRASDLTVLEHVRVFTSAQKYVDSAIAKTCNVSSDVPYIDFKNIYIEAWKRGAKGCTTFRENGKRFGILTSLDDVVPENEVELLSSVASGDACGYDPRTGQATGPCSED